MALCGSFRCGCGVVAAGGIQLSGSGESGDPFVIATAPFKLIPVEKTASHVLEIDDIQHLIEMNVSTANTVTVPPASSVTWPLGTQIHLLQTGTGQTTVAAGSGVTINSSATLSLRFRWSGGTLVYRGSDNWVLVGDLAP
jgi:hypothetical protein